MEFTLLFTKNKEQGIIRTFKEGTAPSSKIINIDEARELDIQGFIFDNSLKDDEFLNLFEGELKYYPIRSNAEFNISAEEFEKLNFNDAKTIFDKMRDNWVLQNNLSLTEEIFKVRNHLMGLWPNDRSGFFEELWFILKTNLAATNLVLIYNDMIKAKAENEKNKLVKVKITGHRNPEMNSVNEMDEAIFKNYEKNFGNLFEITDYNKEKGQLVMCITIKKSPVLIMTNIFQLTRLQKALLASLIDGLNH